MTLTFNQPEKYFKYHSSSSRTSYGSDKSIRMHPACTQARTNAGTYTIKNCNSYVSLNASRLYKKESSLKGKNLLYLEQILYYEMTTICMRSTNETDRVALPESVPIHLMIVTDITFTKQQTCIMSFEQCHIPTETTFYCIHKYNAMCDLITSQIKHSQHHLIYPCLLNKKINIIEDKLVIELD